MKRFTRLVRWAGILFTAVILAIIISRSNHPLVRLEVLSRLPTTRLRLKNDTIIAKNYFFFNEVKSNGAWVEATTQPPDARYANYVPPHSFREIELVPAPTNTTLWRCSVTYEDAEGSWYYRATERLGPLKNFLRRYYREDTTVYAEFAP
jgi:hypothetical protein